MHPIVTRTAVSIISCAESSQPSSFIIVSIALNSALSNRFLIAVRERRLPLMTSRFNSSRPFLPSSVVPVALAPRCGEGVVTDLIKGFPSVQRYCPSMRGRIINRL
eukprot:COSAG05_NODE_1603_length_4429_cov_4.856120_3_plen_106_part_00